MRKSAEIIEISTTIIIYCRITFIYDYDFNESPFCSDTGLERTAYLLKELRKSICAATYAKW